MFLTLRSVLLLGLVFIGSSLVIAQDTIRVMHYNVLFYGYFTDFCTSTNNNMSFKEEQLKTIVNYFQPDIFTVNEMGRGATNTIRLKDNALNQDGIDYYENATYSNSTNSSLVNAFYYNKQKFGLLKEAVTNTLLRDINLYHLYYKSEDLTSKADTVFLTCLVAHLKAGGDASDQQTRTAMVTNTMNYLSNNKYAGNILFMGDFNMKSSYEQAYQVMLSHANTDIRMNDPIDVSGVWSNNANMAAYHTQSPRTGTHSCFVTGGMDDRYDFILASDAIMSGTFGLRYLDGSYEAIGQDGNRFNQSLTVPPNLSQPQEIINAMYNFSDHLPVKMDMELTALVPASQQDFRLKPIITITNPVIDKVIVQLQNSGTGKTDITIYSLNGVAMQHFESMVYQDNEIIELDSSGLSQGIYILRIKMADDSLWSFKIIKI